MFKSTKIALKLGSENVWIYCINFNLYLSKSYINNSPHPSVQNTEEHIFNCKLQLPRQL